MTAREAYLTAVIHLMRGVIAKGLGEPDEFVEESLIVLTAEVKRTWRELGDVSGLPSPPEILHWL